MLLVYTHKITPRLTYIFKHIFTRILGVKITFTSKIEDFVAHEGMKISYTKQALGNEIFIKSNELLFSQGIDFVDITISQWDDLPCFFYTSANSLIKYDVFAASFYLMSRYEEYLPHVKDEYDRFPAEESLAFQNGFLDTPIIDHWAYKLRDALIKENVNEAHLFDNPDRTFQLISTIDVDQAFCYKHKGLIRNLGGVLKDLFQFKFSEILLRFMVIFKFRKDPFDTYSRLLYLQKKFQVPTIFFFLLSEYTTHDKNIPSRNMNYKLLIKNVADYAKVGIHPSYFSMIDELKMQKEKEKLENIVNFPIEKSRQHYLRLALPETYQNLVDLEIKEDYSMGYASQYGFRAGTCTPFYFYDLDFEIQTPLKVFPFAAMDGTFKDYLNYTPKKSYDTILNLAKKVQEVDGTFITLFHNDSVSGNGRWRGWRKVYENLLKELA